MTPQRTLKNILVTGGCGFIGCNFIHYLLGMSTSGSSAFTDAQFDGIIVNLDNLTYAGNPESLADIDRIFGTGCVNPAARRYFFEKADICDRAAVEKILNAYHIDTIVHFAAESSGYNQMVRSNQEFYSTTYLPTKYMVLWEKQDILRKQPRMIQGVPIQPVKRPVTIWYPLIFIPTVYR